jgi:hypothetical protein
MPLQPIAFASDVILRISQFFHLDETAGDTSLRLLDGDERGAGDL